MNLDILYEDFPAIEGNRLSLKKIEVSHLDDVFSIYNNDRVFEYCGILPKHNIETVKNMIGHFERDYNKRSRSNGGSLFQDRPASWWGSLRHLILTLKSIWLPSGIILMRIIGVKALLLRRSNF